MTIPQLKLALSKARQEQRRLRKRIDRYRHLLLKKGVNPDEPEVNLVSRNKNIYKMRKGGKTFREIGSEFHLSTTTVSLVCKRIDNILEKKRKLFDKYKDLLRSK